MTAAVAVLLWVVAGVVVVAGVDLAVMRDEGRGLPFELLLMLLVIWPVVLTLGLLAIFDD